MMAVTLTSMPKYEQHSTIHFLILENVLCSEIHTRMRVVYSTQNIIPKSTVNR